MIERSGYEGLGAGKLDEACVKEELVRIEGAAEGRWQRAGVKVMNTPTIGCLSSKSGRKRRARKVKL